MMALASAMTPLGICGSGNRLCTGGSVKKGVRGRERESESERACERAREEENKAKESGDGGGQVLE